MQGYVTPDREAVISVTVAADPGAPDAQTLVLKTVVDTGFTDYLTLPSTAVSSLGLQTARVTVVTLADGSSAALTFIAYVYWHDQWRRIQVLEADGGPLLGMALLYGSRLVVDVIDGGPATVESLA